MKLYLRAIALIVGLAPSTSQAFIYEEWISCAGFFDVLDVGHMDDPAAIRTQIDEAANDLHFRFSTFHGIAMADTLRTRYREDWLAKPDNDQTALELAETLTRCLRVAERNGFPIPEIK